MGRLVQGNASNSTQEYTEYFPTKPWGGTVQSFTVPAGVKQIKLSAVGVGGCLAGSATTSAMNAAYNNAIFARLNGIDPPFVSFAKPSSTYFSIGLSGKFVYGSIFNSEAAGINGSGDVSSSGRMNGSYFNALDAIPWGISVSQGTGAAQIISTTKDGFNFTHTAITTSNSPTLLSCVFGGNGQAMVALGADSTGTGDNLWYTNNYGATWKNLAGAYSGFPILRVRYLNGYWIAGSNSVAVLKYTSNPLTASGGVAAWASTAAITGGATVDIGWTGTTAVLVYENATNVQISPWAAGEAPSGTWTTQAHGGDLIFTVCESSPYVGGATCSFATNQMTCTVAPTTGAFAIGQVITSAGVTAGTTITAFGTGAGGLGTYTLSTSPGTIAAQSCTAGGEVVLFKQGTGLASAASIRATFGAATTYNSVGNVFAITGAGGTRYDGLKYLPFTSGGMWAIGNSNYSGVVTTVSAVYATLNVTSITTNISGNTLTNATAINNLQYLGSNYCSLATSNGLGKYSAPGVVTASLNSAAQLTAEFGYTDTTKWAPSFSIARNGVEVLALQGGGTTNAFSGSTSGAGGSGQYQGVPGGVPGTGPTGAGGKSQTVSPYTPAPSSGNGGAVVGNVNTPLASGGGGTWQFQSTTYQPTPDTIIPGASGAGYGGISYCLTGGGGSLFSPGGSVYPIDTIYNSPGNTYRISNRLGSYGGGAHGAAVLTSTFYGAGGGAQGCYKYSIPCEPGDVFTLTLPGACYVNANGATGTDGGPGGESYAIIQYNA